MGKKKSRVPRLGPEIELEDDFIPSAPSPLSVTKFSQHHNLASRNVRRSSSFGHSSEVPEDAVVPSAPALDLMDQLSGYEMTSFDASVCIPPPYDPEESNEGTGHSRAPVAVVPPLTEAQARAQLLSFVADKCCWGRGAAKDMAITRIVTTSAHHYELQTFTEKRETSWAFTPYGGGEIDGPMYGTPPKPWEISATPTELFRNEVKVLPVPHTASVKPCHRCKGTGSLLCQECHGKGWTRCLSCHGDGWHTDTSGHRERCYFCTSSSHGRGRQDCLKCNAKGRVACPPCDSYGQIRCFISLTLTWKTYTSEHIVEKTSCLPEGLIREVSGQVVLEEEGPRVIPLKNFPESTINLASTQLVGNHSQQWPDEKMLAQRQQVRLVPIYEVHYTWKRYQGQFFLYGYENKIYAPEYPQTCCWGCTIM